jgi:dynein heavy chain 1
MVPKLVADDIPLLRSLLSDVFPGIPYVRAEVTALRAKICDPKVTHTEGVHGEVV